MKIFNRSLISFFYCTCSLAIQSTILSLCCLLYCSLKLIIHIKHIKISLCKITLPTKNNIIPLNKYIINQFGQEILLKVRFEADYEPFSRHYMARNNQNCSHQESSIIFCILFLMLDCSFWYLECICYRSNLIWGWFWFNLGWFSISFIS